MTLDEFSAEYEALTEGHQEAMIELARVQSDEIKALFKKAMDAGLDEAEAATVMARVIGRRNMRLFGGIAS